MLLIGRVLCPPQQESVAGGRRPKGVRLCQIGGSVCRSLESFAGLLLVDGGSHGVGNK